MDIKLFQHCCKKGDPFQGLKVGSCLTLGNEWFKETHVLTKQEILLGRGTWADSRNPGELSASRPVFHGDGISFRVVFSQSFTTFLVVPIGTIHQPRWMLMPARRILGGGWIHSVTFDLSWTLLVGGGLLVPCSLAGPPVLKQLMQMVTMLPG